MLSLNNVVVGNGGSIIKDGGVNINNVGIVNGVASAGLFNKSLNDASTTQTIPHNLGKSPTNITFDIIAGSGTFITTQYPEFFSTTIWSSSSQSTTTTVTEYSNSSTTNKLSGSYDLGIYISTSIKQGGNISVDNTNIYITWTLVNSYVGIARVLWNAMA